MKNVATALTILVAVLLLTASQAFAQPTLPDYTKWQKGASSNRPAVHNGNDVVILAEFYENLDIVNLYSHGVLIIYDEQKRPWIALYTRVTLYRDGNKLVPAGTEYYLFENTSNQWSFVKDFSQSEDLEKETADFLKNRYDLVLKY